MSKSFITSLLILTFPFISSVSSADVDLSKTKKMKCQEKAVRVILSKGVGRGDITTLKDVKAYSSDEMADKKYEAFDIFVNVKTTSGVSYDQVCRIILKKSNCSYNKTFGCASNTEIIEDGFSD